MKVFKPQKLGLLTRCYEYERRFYLSVAVLALHRFSSALASEADMWTFLTSELGAEGVPDAGMAKARGEFLVSGRACQPGGEPRGSCDVRVRVADQEKRLRVFGDRYWRTATAFTDPLPFVEMPIAWETAFGGPGFDRNPLGKGFAPVELEQGPAHPLPNVEWPDQPVRSLEDRPEPAGMGPIDPMWPQRLHKAGTYDEAWLEQRFPGFAYDIDWSIFNIAPEGQQRAEAFRGDEDFEIEGMHPERAVLTGRLPEMAARCFLTQRGDGAETLHEVAMRLTTLWLFPHAETYLLVFHGVHPVAEEDASDVLQALIAAEPLGRTKPVEHYEKVRRQRMDPDEGAIHALRDADLLPDTPAILAAEDQATAEMQALMKTEDLLRRNQRRRTDREIEEKRAFIASLGLDPDEHGPAPLPPDTPQPSTDEVLAMGEKLKADGAQTEEEQKQRRAAFEEDLRGRLDAEDVDTEAIMAEPHQAAMGPPKFKAEAEIGVMETLLEEHRAQGSGPEVIEELTYLATDPERRQRVFDLEQNLREGYRQQAHQQEAPPRLTGEAAARSKATVQQTRADRGSLARLDMTGFDLSGLDLAGVDLQGAWLENANLAGANLAGANLAEAVLTRADLVDTDLSGANLSRANLGLAELRGTKLAGAVLSEAIAAKARFDGAVVREARLDGADLSEATFAATDLSGAVLAGMVFMKMDLRGATFAGADLSQCTFLESDVSGVDFSGAKLEQSTFLKCAGEGAVFTAADLSAARFVQGCAFERAVFRQALLSPGALRGSRLAGSDFTEARLASADLSECDLSGAALARISARGALFLKANLSGANLVSADLMGALLSNAELQGADLRGANLYQADCARVGIDEHTNLAGINQKKARVHPRRPPG